MEIDEHSYRYVGRFEGEELRTALGKSCSDRKWYGEGYRLRDLEKSLKAKLPKSFGRATTFNIFYSEKHPSMIILEPVEPINGLKLWD